MPISMSQDPAWKGDADITGGISIDDLDLLAEGRGRYPRLIVFDDEVKTRLQMWLDDELDKFFLERAPSLDNWRDWQNLYWAEPATKEKNFPFQKAANIVIPLGAIAVEAIQARMMNTLFAVEPFWSVRPRSKEWIQAAKPFESYLQSEVETGDSIAVYEFCQESVLEFTKLGTCVGKAGYEKIVKKTLVATGDDEEDRYVTVRNGAVLDRVPLGNFEMRLSETDPQLAAWCGEKHTFTWGELKSGAQSGRLDKKVVEKIKSHWHLHNQANDTNEGKTVQEKIEELADAEPLWNEEFTFHEIWCSFDVNGDGWDEEIVVDYHKDSGEFLSARYNWYTDLHRPYRYANYVKVEGLWIGIGVCKQVAQFQEEATTIHRQRLDNATLANMSQISIRKGIGYGPGEPIFPGKMWFLDDPQNDIKEFKLSEIYPSSYANEESIIRYFEKRSGANEVILGMPQEGTPGTATSDLARLAEGNKRFDLAMKNYKRFMSVLGVDVVTNMQIFGNRQVHWMILGEDAKWVEMVLRMPNDLVRRGAVIELNVTDSIMNRDLEQRQWMQLFQIITNYYNTVLQLAQLLGGDAFIQIAQKALMASDEALKRLLETFSVPDSDRFALAEDGASGQSNGQISGPPVSPVRSITSGSAGSSGQAGMAPGPSAIGGLPR